MSNTDFVGTPKYSAIFKYLDMPLLCQNIRKKVFYRTLSNPCKKFNQRLLSPRTHLTVQMFAASSSLLQTVHVMILWCLPDCFNLLKKKKKSLGDCK